MMNETETFDYRFSYDYLVVALAGGGPALSLLGMLLGVVDGGGSGGFLAATIACVIFGAAAYLYWMRRTNEQISVRGRRISWCNYAGQVQSIDLDSPTAVYSKTLSGGGYGNDYLIQDGQDTIRFSSSIRDIKRLRELVEAHISQTEQ